MLQFCFVVNTFSAKTVSQSGGFIIACAFHFPQCHGFFFPSYFASVLEDFNLYSFCRFERERTCPLCRALVKAADLRSFGDGSTSLFFQIF